MELITILVVLFVGLTAIAWVLMHASLLGYERYESVFRESTETNFERLFLFFDARKVFLVNIAAWLVLPLVIYLTTDSLFYVVVTLVGLFVLPKLVFATLEYKRREQIRTSLPDALAQIAGGMRAGSTFVTSMETMVHETNGPISQEFSLVLREHRIGKTLDEALDNLAERVRNEEMDLVVSATQIARDVGGNLAEIFERLSLSLRRKLEMEGKIKALTSQGKLQGWVVGLLPFGIILGLHFVEPEGIQPIFHSLLGWIFLAAILVMEILGAIMIRKIVSIDI